MHDYFFLRFKKMIKLEVIFYVIPKKSYVIPCTHTVHLFESAGYKVFCNSKYNVYKYVVPTLLETKEWKNIKQHINSLRINL